VGRPANRQEHGPAPGAQDGRASIEHGADQLRAELARWSAMVQGEQNIGDSGNAESYAVHEQLATGRKRPSQEHQPDRTQDANNDRNIEMSH